MPDQPTTAARQMVPCPECDNGRVFATFVYTNGDTTDLPAECPYCVLKSIRHPRAPENKGRGAFLILTVASSRTH